MAAFLLLLRLLRLLPPMLLLSSLPTALSDEPCSPADKRAVLLFMKAFGVPYTDWIAADDCCMDGVHCDPDTGRVVYLYISDVGASGPIPRSIGDLPTSLESLYLRKNPNLTGPIPPEITKLTNLRRLEMDWNDLTGAVPPFLGRMASLEVLVLSFNRLSGSIPAALGDLPALRALFLDRNRLTGTLPESLARLSHPSGLSIRLSHNRLTGPIPSSFRCLNISDIDLSRNRFTGDPSVLFTTGDWMGPDYVLFIDLSRNRLEFDLSKAVFSSNLGRLDLNHNRIYGYIPAQMAKIKLQYVNVSYNQLCGEIPQGGLLGGFTEYEFFHNRCLCGKPLAPCK